MRTLILFVVALGLPVGLVAQEGDLAWDDLRPIVSTERTRDDASWFFSRLIGTWDVEQTRRDRDGWRAVPELALWIWTETLGGSAIQDYWVSRSEDAETGAVGQIGTNLRIFDDEAALWRIVWTANDETAFTEYEAVDTGDAVVMTGRHPMSGEVSRITYTLLDDDTLDWLLEFERPTGWLAVSRVRATRRTPTP